MIVKPYKVTTRDVDGTNTRRYATRTAAMKRFKEMSGRTIEDVIEDRFFDVPVERRP